MSDLNEVKAGDYQLVAEMWDEIKSKPGGPLDYVRHRKGATVTLDIDDARRLVAAGAVVLPGALERAQVAQAKAAYEAALALLPPEVRAELENGSGTPEALQSSAPGGDDPKKSDNVATWRAHRIAQGMDPALVSGWTKPQLIAGTADLGDGTPSLPANPGAQQSTPPDPDDTGDGDKGDDEGPVPPPKSGSREDWNQHAVELGWSLEDAEAVSSKDELINQLGYED